MNQVNQKIKIKKQKIKSSMFTKEMNDNNRKCLKQGKTRRGGRHVMQKTNMKPNPVSHLKLFSTNCASVKNGKGKSLNAEVRNTQANIVTVQ